MLGSWIVPNEHLGVDVFEAPNLEALTKLMMEPAIMALGSFESCEVKTAFSYEEMVKMMPKAK